MLFVTSIRDDDSKGDRDGAAYSRWTIVILAAWLAAACAGAFAWGHLGSRLSGTVEVPGSQSQIASDALKEHFGESTEGSFVVLFDAPASKWGSTEFVGEVRSSLRQAARAVDGRVSPLRSAGPTVSYAELATDLPVRSAQERIPAIERAIQGHPETRTEVTGFPVVSDEVSAVIAEDLRRAELIAIPITALILIFFFGSLSTAAIPLLFGLTTISVAMGVVWLQTWLVTIPIYATNVVTLVGIALAVDYSMLYVARFREETRRGSNTARALPTTVRTTGHALAISGAVVVAGLAPLAFVPIPFFSGLGLAAIVIPVVSVLAAVTLLPALLRVLAPRLERTPLRPRRRNRRGKGSPVPDPGARLIDFVMRRAGLVALASGAVMLIVALPAGGLELMGSSAEFVRRAQPQLANQGGTPEPPPARYEVVIDSGRPGGAWLPNELATQRRLLRELAGSDEVEAVQAPVEAGSQTRARRLGLVDPSARFSRIRVTGTHPNESAAAETFVERLRSGFIPRAGLDASHAWVGGPPASDRDFVHAIEESIPLLALVIVALMYILLVVLLRSPILPLKAIVMSALSVAAACGVLVAVFQLGLGDLTGTGEGERTEAWVPVMLFAALFGISTDYEVFMVTRMREEWQRTHDNERAVRTGLRLVSRVVTASALVMLAIFAGFTASRVTALQQFGVGLVAGVFFDATVIRLLLVPSLMKLMGRWNWSFRSPRKTETRPTGELHT